MWPKLGFGVGLRPKHYPYILEHKPRMDWFEAVSENYIDSGGRPLHMLEQIRKNYPIVLHGVSLSIGSTDPLNRNYLKRLKALVDRIEPELVSDHLCWTGVDGENLHDLLPLPHTKETVEYVAQRVQQVQEFLGRKILLENVSSYIGFQQSIMSEWEFLTAVTEKADCGILLDLNNIYVNSFNRQFDPQKYLENIPIERVAQFHLAGHTDMGNYLFDTHTGEIISPVWDLYQKSVVRFGDVPALVEWDTDIPEFSELQKLTQKAKEIFERNFNHHKKIDVAA